MAKGVIGGFVSWPLWIIAILLISMFLITSLDNASLGVTKALNKLEGLAPLSDDDKIALYSAEAVQHAIGCVTDPAYVIAHAGGNAEFVEQRSSFPLITPISLSRPYDQTIFESTMTTPENGHVSSAFTSCNLLAGGDALAKKLCKEALSDSQQYPLIQSVNESSIGVACRYAIFGESLRNKTLAKIESAGQIRYLTNNTKLENGRRVPSGAQIPSNELSAVSSIVVDDIECGAKVVVDPSARKQNQLLNLSQNGITCQEKQWIIPGKRKNEVPKSETDSFCDGRACIRVVCPTTESCDVFNFWFPQTIRGDSFLANWAPAFGDPKYILFYESLPYEEATKWQIPASSNLMTAIAIEGIFLIPGGKAIKGAKQLIKEGSEVGAKEAIRLATERTTQGFQRWRQINKLSKVERATQRQLQQAKNTDEFIRKSIVGKVLRKIPFSAVETVPKLSEEGTERLLRNAGEASLGTAATATKGKTALIQELKSASRQTTDELGKLKTSLENQKNIWAQEREELIEEADDLRRLVGTTAGNADDLARLKSMDDQIAKYGDDIADAETKIARHTHDLAELGKFTDETAELYAKEMKKYYVQSAADGLRHMNAWPKLYEKERAHILASYYQAATEAMNNPSVRYAALQAYDWVDEELCGPSDKSSSYYTDRVFVEQEELDLADDLRDCASDNGLFDSFAKAGITVGRNPAKHKLATLTLATMSYTTARLESINDKYKVVGINSLGWDRPFWGTRELLLPNETHSYYVELSRDGAYRDNSEGEHRWDAFRSLPIIRLFLANPVLGTRGEVDQAPERFFLVSPCRTDLKVTNRNAICEDLDNTDYIEAKTDITSDEFVEFSFLVDGDGNSVAWGTSVSTDGLGNKLCNSRGFMESTVDLFGTDATKGQIKIVQIDPLNENDNFLGSSSYCYSGVAEFALLEDLVNVVNIGAAIVSIAFPGPGTAIGGAVIGITAAAATPAIEENTLWPNRG